MKKNKKIKDLVNNKLKIGDNVAFTLSVAELDYLQSFALDDGTSRLGLGIVSWIDEESELVVIGSTNDDKFVLRHWLGLICVKPRKIGDFVVGDRVAFENLSKLDSGIVFWINKSQPPTYAAIRCGNNVVLKSSCLLVSVKE